ncbi:MAG TPA: aldo/keto reductase [Acidobacteriota bacterium]|nr:aldo/keto reductase [Acidobacteriota bacterium]HNJ39058.1 aldo/keto reductase [Acidobacteriota bacterium]
MSSVAYQAPKEPQLASADTPSLTELIRQPAVQPGEAQPVSGGTIQLAQSLNQRPNVLSQLLLQRKFNQGSGGQIQSQLTERLAQRKEKIVSYSGGNVVQLMKANEIKLTQGLKPEHPDIIYRIPVGAANLPPVYRYGKFVGRSGGALMGLYLFKDKTGVFPVVGGTEIEISSGGSLEENRTAFGLDERNEEQIKAAVEAGYRVFDAAESYGNTDVLAKVLAESPNLTRNDVKIVYKFRPGEPAQTIYEKLKGVAEKFGGYLDVVLLHDVEESQQNIEGAFKAIQVLKKEGIVKAVGASNIKADSETFAKIASAEDEQDSIYKVDVLSNRFSPKGPDEKIREFAKSRGITYLGFGLMGGVVNDEHFQKWAQELGYTASQLLFAWAQAHGTIPVASSKNTEVIGQNFLQAQTPVPLEVVQQVEEYWAKRREEAQGLGDEVLAEIPPHISKLLTGSQIEKFALGQIDDSTWRGQASNKQTPIGKNIFFLTAMLQDPPATVPPLQSIRRDLWGKSVSDLVSGLATSNSCNTLFCIDAILKSLRYPGNFQNL